MLPVFASAAKEASPTALVLVTEFLAAALSDGLDGTPAPSKSTLLVSEKLLTYLAVLEHRAGVGGVGMRYVGILKPKK